MASPFLLADAGTPLMWAGGWHLLFGNALIGVGEGLLIAWLFKFRVRRAVPWMVAANYLSMILGVWLMNGSLAERFGQWFLGDAPLYRIGWLLLVAALFSYVLTIFLEWPFIIAAMWKTRHSVRRTLLASLVAQTASYSVLALFYGGVASSLSLISQPTITTARGLIRAPTATVYFIDARDSHVYQLTLDGSPRRRLDATVDLNEWAYLELRPSVDGAAMDLCVTTRGKQAIIIAGITPKRTTGPAPYHAGDTVDLRPPNSRAWDVFVRGWPSEGLRATNAATGARIHLALETPFLSWWSSCATILPDDQVIYQVGEQVVLLDLATKRLAPIARGICPVVILPPATPTTIPTPTRNSTANGDGRNSYHRAHR